MLSVHLILIGLMSSAALANINLHGEPLLSPVTSFTLAMETTTIAKPTTCYVTSGEVTQCRRKRGMEEKPIQYNNGKLKIVPSVVIGIETTPVPRAINPVDVYNAYKIFSSFDDSYRKTQNIFQKLAQTNRNSVTVGDCGMATVNFIGFLSCLGMTVQETTTLTATFRETSFTSSGYTVMTVMGCTPAGFPYPFCPSEAFTTASTSVAATAKPPATDSPTTEAPFPVTEAPSPATDAPTTESTVIEPTATSPATQTTAAPTASVTLTTETSTASVTVTVTVTTTATTATTEPAETTAAITEPDSTEPTAP